VGALPWRCYGCHPSGGGSVVGMTASDLRSTQQKCCVGGSENTERIGLKMATIGRRIVGGGRWRPGLLDAPASPAASRAGRTRQVPLKSVNGLTGSPRIRGARRLGRVVPTSSLPALIPTWFGAANGTSFGEAPVCWFHRPMGFARYPCVPGGADLHSVDFGRFGPGLCQAPGADSGPERQTRTLPLSSR
jgi:hypothetical protein